MHDEIGQAVAGNVYAQNIHFNYGGQLIKAVEASTEQLQSLYRAYARAINVRSNRCVGALALMVLQLMLCVLAAHWIWLYTGGPATGSEVLKHKLALAVTMAIPTTAMTFLMVSDWWREQRDILRVLRRERAVLRAQLDVRSRMPATAG